MTKTRKRVTWVLTLLVAAGHSLSGQAQEKSVNPGINKSYQDPDVQAYLKRFEVESREVYAHRKEIVKACQIKPGMVIADIGSGTGLFTRLFSKAVGPKGTVFAVDISKSFLQYITDSAKEKKLDNITTVLCSQTSTKLKPNSVDLVYICDTYHHFEFPYRTMDSIHKALKPGGKLVVIDYHRIKGKSREFIMGHVRAGQEVFTKEIESCGFRQIEERKNLLEENYFLRFAKVAASGESD